MSKIDPRKAYEDTAVQRNWPAPALAAFLIFLGTFLGQQTKDYPQPKQYTATTERNQIAEALAEPVQDEQIPSELPIEQGSAMPNILKPQTKTLKPNITRLSQETNNTEIQ